MLTPVFFARRNTIIQIREANTKPFLVFKNNQSIKCLSKKHKFFLKKIKSLTRNNPFWYFSIQLFFNRILFKNSMLCMHKRLYWLATADFIRVFKS